MIPRTERVVVTYLNNKEEAIAILTQKPTDGSFFLYEISGNDTKRLGKGANPLVLEEKYHIRKRMGIIDG